ncbi:MAG: alpha/beta hydrolase [Acidimicrobiales bacterium]|nr:alpha/beta hydrolase [Acidimicrobiales bacterium]MBO0886145.1 alpha/beta hydrolase [Acidimicrobiales bacterium]
MTIDTGMPGADPEAMRARRAEAEALTASVRRDFAHELGIAYGDHPKQRLDLYLPERPAGPTLVFLHGGAFRAGDPGSVGYHGRPYLEHGAIFVSMGYRLVPDAKFPDCADDLEAGLTWLQAHLAERGGDPERIHVSGHSAGATLGALVAMRPKRLHPADLVKGLVAISGMYDYTRRSAEVTNFDSPHFVPKLTESIERLPDHTIVVAADKDLPACLPDAEALVSAVRQRGGSVEMFVERDADHFQANRSFIAEGGAVFGATARMMKL